MAKFLTPEQRKQLTRELQGERGRKHADRIRVILLLDQGETYSNIARFLFLDEGTIGNYRRRYKEGGLEQLLSDDYQGSSSFLSLEDQMKLDLHLQTTIYTCTRSLLSYINKTFHVEYSVSGVTRLLRSMNFSYKKPKALPGKAKLEVQKAFIAEYRALKSEGKIYFGDAVHPQHNPVLGYGWIKRGVEMEIPTNAGRLHLNIVGALCLDGMDVITRNFKRVNADSICTMLKAIREKNPDRSEKLFYILDNARYHHAKKVKALAGELEITLVYLPGYSPNLNPIERLWKFFKKKVMYNTYYPTFDEFKLATSSFFKGLRGLRCELTTLLTDNFRPMGT